ncbi:protein of unknown function [Desulfuromusa kysingii]|uniref:Response regulatory domain-containing protein n=1 Tax=Desulfuromusa kysingii TaxID=37625 RepID=A0A1H4DT10_9BACT|nr:response regulator [Desulfuromusa kysingii]SEA75322.1 protein of unknown function [Desulfuromusa kysingii]
MDKVLIVDDEKSFLLSLHDGLSKHKEKFEVLCADNGREAIDILRTTKVNLLLTDLKMPEMNGFEILAWVLRYQPKLSVIVMSAFGTPEIEERAEAMNALQFLNKPLDLETVESAIFEGLSTGTNSFIRGITLATFLQLMHVERKTCTLTVTSAGKCGHLYLFAGELVNAEIGDISGIEAALSIIGWDNAEIVMCSVCERRENVINFSMEHLLMEAFRAIDEANHGIKANKQLKSIVNGSDRDCCKTAATQGEEVGADHINTSTDGNNAKTSALENDSEQNHLTTPKGVQMMEEKMEVLKKIKGFIAAGAFSADGEIMAEVSVSSTLRLAEVGALANDILLKAQEETDIMGVGRGSMVHIVAPKANLLMRCLNENTDFHNSEAGRAHIHMLVVLEADANVALAKMQLEKVILDIAEEVR